MKRLKLSANDGTPDFPAAVGVVSAIIVFSCLISLAAFKFPGIAAEPVFAIMLGLFGTSLITAVLLCYVFARFGGYLISILKPPVFPFIRKGLRIYLLFLPLLFLIALLSSVFFKSMGLEAMPQQIFAVYMQADSFYVLFSMFFLSCIAAPFAEEVIFRGVIYTALKEKFSVPSAIIISSLLFALLHNEIFQIGALFAFGILLAYIFEKHDNLWLSISVHFFNNLFANAAIFLIKYAGITEKVIL
ncbi:MAG: CPBP family intramembrane metalloprotease [Candidatus Omnitrophica bacterium]|nr:CPBP family intramembrane metalloprotease [Candidatus Omnitrophota bacterium]